VIEALAWMPSAAATICPVPTAVAENVTGVPGFGLKLPRAGDTDHVGETLTGFP
jgi:hypothetical protein